MSSPRRNVNRNFRSGLGAIAVVIVRCSTVGKNMRSLYRHFCIFRRQKHGRKKILLVFARFLYFAAYSDIFRPGSRMIWFQPGRAGPAEKLRVPRAISVVHRRACGCSDNCCEGDSSNFQGAMAAAPRRSPMNRALPSSQLQP